LSASSRCHPTFNLDRLAARFAASQI